MEVRGQVHTPYILTPMTVRRGGIQTWSGLGGKETNTRKCFLKLTAYIGFVDCILEE
jgi:hypothetical protein